MGVLCREDLVFGVRLGLALVLVRECVCVELGLLVVRHGIVSCVVWCGRPPPCHPVLLLALIVGYSYLNWSCFGGS